MSDPDWWVRKVEWGTLHCLVVDMGWLLLGLGIQQPKHFVEFDRLRVVRARLP